MLKYKQKPVFSAVFPRPDTMDPIIYELLVRRGITSAEQAETFLHPSISGLHDPGLLNDCDIFKQTLQDAVRAGEHICVYGDYDADGVCACAIMFFLLKKMDADFEIYIPSRHNEGYGLNLQAVEDIAKRSDLLITVDCGISNIAEIEAAKALGMKCLVTDHHRPGEQLPDCPVVNPLLGNYPFPWLCGAGIAFKLTHAMLGREEAMDVIDIAAIATVADIVSLTGENRCIVRLGLDKINKTPRPGLLELMKRAGIDGRGITGTDIAFRIAPRLNAGGRLGSARRSFEVLIAEDEFDGMTGADELENANTLRKELQEKIIAEAREQLNGMDFFTHKIIMVKGAGWDHGVIGLAAANLQKRFNYPVIVFAEKDGMLTGSCRSIPGIDIYQTLASASDLMVKYGGHAQAAGLTIEKDDFDALWERLDSYIADHCDPDAFIPTVEYDLDLPLERMDEELMRAIDRLEPFGQDNPAPVFRACAELLEKRPCGSENKHLQLIAAQSGKHVRGIYYSEGPRADMYGQQVEILFKPSVNEWQGRVRVEMQVESMRNAQGADSHFVIRRDPEELKYNFLTEIVYNKKYKVDKSAPIISEDALVGKLRETTRGTYVFCGNLETAHRIFQRVGNCRIDFSEGRVPTDPRGFNTIVFWPDKPGQIPLSVRTVVFADTPVPDMYAGRVCVFALEGCACSDIDVPTVDDMREVYKAARTISRMPAIIRDMPALLKELSFGTGLSVTACGLSVMALLDMGLITMNAGLKVPAARKTDPESSAVWRAICELGRK